MEHNQHDQEDESNLTPTPSPNPTIRPSDSPKKTNKMALASMIIGISALISCCFSPIGFALGVTGIVLVIFSKKGHPLTGFAIAGLVLSILAIIASLLSFAYYMAVISLAKDPQFAPMFNEINDIMEKYQTMPVQ